MPDTVSIDGQPIIVTGEMTEDDAKNGKTLAAEVGTILLFLYFYGLFDSQGRRISETIIRRAVDDLVVVAGSRIERLTMQLLNGDISLAVWQARMRNIIKAGHAITGSIARGGLQRMRPEDWLKLTRLTEKQMRYLNRFAAELASEAYDKTEKATLARARSYATSIRSTANQMVLENAREMKLFVRRILTASESCVGCIALAKQGWMPAELMPPIGSQECGSHCRCYFETRAEAVTERDRRLRRMSDRWNTVEEITVRL